MTLDAVPPSLFINAALDLNSWRHSTAYSIVWSYLSRLSCVSQVRLVEQRCQLVLKQKKMVGL